MKNTSNNFMSYLKNEATQTTENGAVGYVTSGRALLDMNFKLSSYRNMTDNDIINDFMEAYKENKNYALKFLFYARDVLEGQGERRFFRTILRHMAVMNIFPDTLVREIPAYGRYDDWFELFDTPLEPTMINCVIHQLSEDNHNRLRGKSYSLLAKWMPSINTSSKAKVDMAYKFVRAMGISCSHYRKLLAAMRKGLNVVETKMTANQWENIDYSAVPSKANANYKNAFMAHDPERRQAFLHKAVKGEVKMNAKTLAPYEIVAKYTNNLYRDDDSLEALWKNLPTKFDVNQSTMVVADGSGSMAWARVGNTNARPLDVANALAIYFAERNSGAYKNKYITFSSNPKYVEFPANANLRQKINLALAHDECSNTDIEAVFDLILNVAKANHLTQSELPAQVLILSDMEFDQARRCGGYYAYHSDERTLFDTIRAKYARAGYKMPKLIFWNICGRTNTIPTKVNDNGVILVSGFSTNTFKMVMSNKTDPYQALLEVLNSDRYAKIVAKI